MNTETLDTFVAHAKKRRAVRHFQPNPLPDGVLDRLLEAAQWAPSGYNLQPTHWVVVTDKTQRERLRRACMDQQQITEAPAAIVFVGDMHVARHHFDAVLKQDQDAGAINDDYVRLLKQFVPLAFGTGPLGIGWLWKALLLPIVQRFRPIPSIPAVRRRYWLAKQCALSAMNFMLAAEAAGLATCPMEGFCERRVRQVLSLPKGMLPILVTPLGYATDEPRTKTRLPREQLVHHEKWGFSS